MAIVDWTYLAGSLFKFRSQNWRLVASCAYRFTSISAIQSFNLGQGAELEQQQQQPMRRALAKAIKALGRDSSLPLIAATWLYLNSLGFSRAPNVSPVVQVARYEKVAM